MGIHVQDPAIAASRWAEKTERAAQKAVLTGTTHEEIARGLALIAGGAYTVVGCRGAPFSLTLPRALCDLLGLKVGSRVVYVLNEAGHVEIRPATLEDLPEYARAAAARADEILAAQRPQPLLRHLEKICEQCGHLYCARRSSQRFCPVCGLLRARASDRRHWHRRGKLTPSYARKLKGRRGAEAELATPQAEGNADGATHDALVRG
jgi:hypothetical protein